MSRWLAVPIALAAWAVAPSARADCAAPNPARVAITAALGVGAGAAGALISSGILAGADDTREFKLGIGFAVGAGVTAGLTGIYAVVDASSNCAMVTDFDGIVWTIPVVMGVVGTLLPLAVWGAAEKVGEPESEPAPAPAGLTIRF